MNSTTKTAAKLIAQGKWDFSTGRIDRVGSGFVVEGKRYPYLNLARKASKAAVQKAIAAAKP